MRQHGKAKATEAANTKIEAKKAAKNKAKIAPKKRQPKQRRTKATNKK
jgi:hypothetical protein